MLLLLADGELDAFINDQHSDWLTGVAANPLRTECAEPREEFDSDIVFRCYFGRERGH